MNLGVQYYRAPFPEQKYWQDDLARMKDSGLNTVQLWVLWGWVEAKPGQFCFDDYDRLVELAEKNSLGVVLSTIAEIHPYWIHHQVPGSEMIDHMGRQVISSNRRECHFGLTPGGCTDHPGVWQRMARFLTATTERYRSAANLRGWDAWNELRWNVQSDGLVCFCRHTVRAFRQWLSDKYGGLDGLNKAWKRRYGSFEEVLPGKLHQRPYTEMMAFEHFLTFRANQHGNARYDLIKSLDPHHLVTVHAASPSPLSPGDPEDQPVNRGNDWFFADHVDGVGCSSFPKWQGLDDADFGARIEFVKSAARGKAVWLSELQGGRSAVGFEVYDRVDPQSQQHWIWNGIACGADTILFWCWRDEVFGRESAGFGLDGLDGLAEQRLAAMKITGRLLEQHHELIDRYQPATGQVGVFFSPQSYYLTWAHEGSAVRCANGLRGYVRSLVRKSIPYLVVEEEHLDVLSDLKILFMPRTIVTSEAAEHKLAQFVKNGGTLLCESECGAFSPAGLYRYPEDRFTTRLTGVGELGRRSLSDQPITANIADQQLTLVPAQWLTPWQKTDRPPWAQNDDGALLTEIPVGKGRVILCASYLGDDYLQNGGADFENFVELLARRAGWQPQVEVISPKPQKDSFVYVKHGTSANKKMIFVFFPENQHSVQLRLTPGFFPNAKATDLISDRPVALSETNAGQECTLSAARWALVVLAQD